MSGAAAIRADGEAIASMSGHTVLVYTRGADVETGARKSLGSAGSGGKGGGGGVPVMGVQ